VILTYLWRATMALGPAETAFELVRIDGFGLFFSFILLAIGMLTLLGSVHFIEREDVDHGEFYALILFCLAGMLMMVQTTNLMMVLIGLEVFSLSLYVLTGLTRNRVRAIESALKYFLLGAFSSGFMIYGMALIYGSTGSLDMYEIAQAAAGNESRLLVIGMGLMLVGLMFKIGAVPFHFWVPDVYQGAPTNVAGFMAAATKTAAFAVLLRFLVGAFGDQREMWVPLIAVLAALTMTVANLVALAQTNLKRLLAYSSIAHAGYLLIAVVCRPGMGVKAILFYLLSYAFMTVGAFAVLAAVGKGDPEGERGYTLREWAGLGWKRPVLGVAMSIFLFSLAGIPPTAGFIGKYVVFQAAVEADQWLLLIVGVINAAIAAYYYLRVLVTMYMREAEDDEMPLPVSAGMAAVMILAVVGVLYFGIMPGGFLELVANLATSLI
jgi:NADH-quinone oxidoreductase subunit N